jgi:hypothetical protein
MSDQYEGPDPWEEGPGAMRPPTAEEEFMPWEISAEEANYYANAAAAAASIGRPDLAGGMDEVDDVEDYSNGEYDEVLEWRLQESIEHEEQLSAKAVEIGRPDLREATGYFGLEDVPAARFTPEVIASLEEYNAIWARIGESPELFTTYMGLVGPEADEAASITPVGREALALEKRVHELFAETRTMVSATPPPEPVQAPSFAEKIKSILRKIRGVPRGMTAEGESSGPTSTQAILQKIRVEAQLSAAGDDLPDYQIPQTIQRDRVHGREH